MSASLKQALLALPRADGFVLPYRTPVSAWCQVQALCEAAVVAATGVHALRHAVGTRRYAETQDPETTARHLGHTTRETTRVYATWSDRRLWETIGRWYGGGCWSPATSHRWVSAHLWAHPARAGGCAW